MAGTRGRRSAATDAAEPKRRNLTRDKLIAAALELIDARGADALTMRALSQAVGVTPMALYSHFDSKRALQAAVADHVVSAAQFDGGHANWREQVRHCFETLRELCLRHPALPALLEVEGVAPPTAFAPMEVTLRALKAAGLDELASMRTHFLLIGFTLSQAAYQSKGPAPSLDPSRQTSADRLAERGYPTVARLQLSQAWDFDASFAFGLDLILEGVEAIARSTVSVPGKLPVGPT